MKCSATVSADVSEDGAVMYGRIVFFSQYNCVGAEVGAML